ncbi:unnamed protein product, partial [Staurois parvus]
MPHCVRCLIVCDASLSAMPHCCPMRCPWFFYRLFSVWARTQGPHDPLLPRGP